MKGMLLFIALAISGCSFTQNYETTQLIPLSEYRARPALVIPPDLHKLPSPR